MDNLLMDVQQAIQTTPDLSKTLGPYIGKIKSFQKMIAQMELVEWIQLGGGSLSIGHRPSIKLVSDLKMQAATHIFTLLSEKENCRAIGKLTKNAGLNWLWFPMESARNPDLDRYAELKMVFEEIKEILENEGKIYLHCSAGIHRTGMISFALLRFLGFDPESCAAKLKSLRIETSEGVGKNRIAWANSFITNTLQ
ncbi:protein-tyrosine phosphatase family protein [Algoriphagus antarcticus]|nr:dual specificity protein phosphatase family protein [Algoriphagus antarcticus]